MTATTTATEGEASAAAAGDQQQGGRTFQQDIYPKVIEVLPADPGRLVDVGAGEGYFCRLAKERGFQVEACDFFDGNFSVEGVPFHHANLNDSLPFEDDSIDTIVNIEVLEHLENHTRFFREVLRVLKPGGTAILTTPNVLSVTSRWHFFLYGYTDCAPRPLDPYKDEHWRLHINPISLPEIMFQAERFGGELVGLHTNRMRRSSNVPAALLGPLFKLAIRRKLVRKKYERQGILPLYERHIRWVTHPANLKGRITIAVIRKREDAAEHLARYHFAQ